MNKKIKSFLLLVVALIIGSTSLFWTHSLSKKKETVVRAAIDIGSGATKLKVAKIDLKTQKIDTVLVNESFSVQYQEDLEKSKRNQFSDEVMETGLEALKKSAEIAKKHGADKVVAVATASFRKASNVDAFVNRIQKELGIDVYIIDQYLEGALGFEATTAQISSNPEDVIVWDIGGGSFQFSMIDEEGNINVYRGVDASIPFKNRVIEQIKKEDPDAVSTPNPLTLKEIHEAKSHAHLISSNIDDLFKEKISHPSTQVVGIGNIFAYGIHPLVDKKSHFTKEELSLKIKELNGKTDEDLGGHEYTNVAVTNPILVLGFMQTLGIDEMDLLDVNNADGALLYKEFWT